MRVLSVPQPFAQLLVRGIVRCVVRTWDPPYRGAVAVHASAAVPSKAQAAAWFADAIIARRFADQGWSDRDDLKALPFGAIVGTAQLAEAHLGRDVREGNAGHLWWAPPLEGETAVPDRERGMLQLVKSKRPVLAVSVPDDAFAWVFTDAVECAPIAGVEGRQRLWTLGHDLAGLLADRVRHARKGKWRPAPVDARQRDKAQRALRERRKAERDRLLRDVETRVARRRAVAGIRLRSDVEQSFRRDLARYVAVNAVPPSAHGEPMVRVEPRFLQLVEGRELVPAEELELALRRSVKRNADAQYAARRRQARRERLLSVVQEAESARTDATALRARLESTFDEMLAEEEEDVEFARRERYPLGDEKAMRAKARQEARAAERAAEAREREMVQQMFAAFAPLERGVLVEAAEEMDLLAEARRLNSAAWKAALGD